MHEWLVRYDKLDTNSARRARKEDFWYIMELSGLVMNWNPRYYIFNVLYLMIFYCVYAYFFVCLAVSYGRSPDLTTRCQFLNFLALLMIAMCTVVIVNGRRDVFLRFFEMSGSGFYDYRDTLLSTTQVENWKMVAAKFKKIVLVVIPVYFGTTAGSIMLSDVIDNFFSYPLSNETTINGIHQTLPWKMWFYHPIDNMYVRCLTLLSQMLCSGGVALVIGAADLVMFVGGQNLIIQLKVLIMACQDIDSRADKMYEKVTGEKAPTEATERTKNQVLGGFYKICLKQAVEHHQIILNYASLYQTMLNWPCGLVVINGSIVVAMSGLSMMQGGGQPSMLCTSILLMVGEVASIFVLCEVGENIRNLCEEAFDSMYSFQWMDCSTENKKIINIIKCGMKKPFTLMAGSLTPIDRNTFSSMMNTAYSYMNLVRASNDSH